MQIMSLTTSSWNAPIWGYAIASSANVLAIMVSLVLRASTWVVEWKGQKHRLVAGMGPV